jgi:hypothetical protein
MESYLELLLHLEEATQLKEKIEKGEAAAGWTMLDGLLAHSGCIFVPTASALWPTILATAHGAGHEGVQKTLHRLRASFYNTSVAQLVKDFVKSCAVCQRNKSKYLHLADLLQPSSFRVGVGRHRHRLRGGLSARWGQVSGPDSGGQVLQVRPLHPVGPPVHRGIGGPGVLRQHCQAPRHFVLHRQRL